jgi:hypothetical protein
MEVDQTICNVFQLKIVNEFAGETLSGPTNFRRLTPGCSFTNSLMFPFTIQTEIMAKRFSDIVTPINGITLECLSIFHATTSLQNFYARDSVPESIARKQLTPNNCCKSLFEYVRMTFTATA